jgi:hypothetical protein
MSLTPLKPINNKGLERQRNVTSIAVSAPETLERTGSETLGYFLKRMENTPRPRVLWKSGKASFSECDLYVISDPGWAGSTLDASLRLALQFAHVKGEKTFYINSLLNREACYRKLALVLGDKRPADVPLQMVSITDGSLWEKLGAIAEKVKKENIKVVILNSWEWAAFTPAERARLYRGIGVLRQTTRACVILFTNEKAERLAPEANKRGPLGLLAFLSEAIYDLHKENDILPALYKIFSPPEEKIIPSYMKPKPENQHKRTNEINALEEVAGTYGEGLRKTGT